MAALAGPGPFGPLRRALDGKSPSRQEQRHHPYLFLDQRKAGSRLLPASVGPVLPAEQAQASAFPLQGALSEHELVSPGAPQPAAGRRAAQDRPPELPRAQDEARDGHRSYQDAPLQRLLQG